MGNVYGKMILMLGWSGLVFYDEDEVIGSGVISETLAGEN